MPVASAVRLARSSASSENFLTTPALLRQKYGQQFRHDICELRCHNVSSRNGSKAVGMRVVTNAPAYLLRRVSASSATATERHRFIGCRSCTAHGCHELTGVHKHLELTFAVAQRCGINICKFGKHDPAISRYHAAGPSSSDN